MDIAGFYRTVRKLKDVKRTGWVERGVKDPESVADHSLLVAVLCMVVPAEGIDRERAIKMALVHDLAESETGDIITKENWPGGGTMPRREKAALEEESLRRILSSLDSMVADEILELWKEYEEGKTSEAAFVRDIDLAELIMQASDYHAKGNSRKPLKEFWDRRNLSLIRSKRIKALFGI
jgi:putative hydrolase of HD superfamily